MSLQQDLIAARAVIADPINWTKESLSRTSAGDEIWPTDDTATCWCLGGALLKVVDAPNSNEIDDRYRIAREFLDREFGNGDTPDSDFEDFGEFNDAQSHSALLSCLDRKIEEAAAEQPHTTYGDSKIPSVAANRTTQ